MHGETSMLHLQKSRASDKKLPTAEAQGRSAAALTADFPTAGCSVDTTSSAPGRRDGVTNFSSGQESRDYFCGAGRWLHGEVQQEIQASMGPSTAFEGSPEDLTNFLAARQDPVLLTLSPWLHQLEQ